MVACWATICANLLKNTGLRHYFYPYTMGIACIAIYFAITSRYAGTVIKAKIVFMLLI